MIRRTFAVAEGNQYGLPPHEVLVTFNETTGVMHVAQRLHEWEAFTVPCEQIAEDDEPLGIGNVTGRVYQGEGRVYDPQQYVPPASAVAEAEATREHHAAIKTEGGKVASPPSDGGDPSGPQPEVAHVITPPDEPAHIIREDIDPSYGGGDPDKPT